MGFKPGKDNIYTKMKLELEQVKKELTDEREKPMLRVFAHRLGTALLVQLASKPYEDWPQFAKDTFAWVATDTPTSAYAYKNKLPKKHS